MVILDNLCLGPYLKKKPTKDQNLHSQNLYDHAGFEWLVSFINEALSENKNCIFFITELRDMYKEWLSKIRSDA